MATGWIFGKFPQHLLNGHVGDLDNALTLIHCAILIDTGFTPVQNTMDDWADVVAYEHTAGGGTGYTAYGVLCGTKTVTTAAKVTTFDLANPTWAALAADDMRYLCFFDNTPVADADKKLIALFDLGTATTFAASVYTPSVSAAGLFTMTVP